MIKNKTTWILGLFILVLVSSAFGSTPWSAPENILITKNATVPYFGLDSNMYNNNLTSYLVWVENKSIYLGEKRINSSEIVKTKIYDSSFSISFLNVYTDNLSNKYILWVENSSLKYFNTQDSVIKTILQSNTPASIAYNAYLDPLGNMSLIYSLGGSGVNFSEIDNHGNIQLTKQIDSTTDRYVGFSLFKDMNNKFQLIINRNFSLYYSRLNSSGDIDQSLTPLSLGEEGGIVLLNNDSLFFSIFNNTGTYLLAKNLSGSMLWGPSLLKIREPNKTLSFFSMSIGDSSRVYIFYGERDESNKVSDLALPVTSYYTYIISNQGSFELSKLPVLEDSWFVENTPTDWGMTSLSENNLRSIMMLAMLYHSPPEYYLKLRYLNTSSIINLTELTDNDFDGISDFRQAVVYKDINSEGYDYFVTKIDNSYGGWVDNEIKNTSKEIYLEGFRDKTINFTHNFSKSQIDLSKITVKVYGYRGYDGIVINTSDQLSSGETKTVIIGNFYKSICVKDEEIADISQISANCNGANEYDFTPCLGSSYSTGGISCVDNGTNIIISGLTHTGIKTSIDSQLVVYDGGDVEGGGYTYYENYPVPFYANYTNLTSGASITGASCNITFDLVNYYPMSYYNGVYNYTKSDGFGTAGIYDYGVVCSHPDYLPLAQTDNVTILHQEGGLEPIPEFSSVGLILSIMILAIGIMVILKNNKR